MWNKFPCGILKKSIELTIHGGSPLVVLKSLGVGGWFKAWWDGMSCGGVNHVGVKVLGVWFAGALWTRVNRWRGWYGRMRSV